MIPNIKSGELVLKPIDKDDYEKLFQWRNSDSFIKNLTSRSQLSTLENFVEELEKDFLVDRHIQFIIFYKTTAIGTIYSYDYKVSDGFVFISAYINNPDKFTGKGAKAFLIFCQYLFRVIRVFKIYMDVYAYNEKTISILENRISIEGEFKRQHLFNGKRFDVLRFAIYENNVEKYFDSDVELF